MVALILRAIREDPEICGLLAGFGGQPAVFYQTAPPDTDGGWEGVQYPRLDYQVDWSFNPERKAAGALAVNVWCLNNGVGAPPEEVGEAVRACLRDLFLTDGSGEIYALEWQRTDAFEAGGGEEPMTVGVTLSFDILAFPVQATTDPDPAEGLNDYIKERFPQCLVVGVDRLPELCRPTEQTPIVYARTTGDGSAMRNSYAVAWMDVALSIHIFTAELMGRRLLARQLCNALAIDGECRLRDGSPMLLRRLALSESANPLQQGQLTISGRYGVLRRERESAPLLHPNTRGEFDHGR